jgi:hypothetical protein
MSTEVTASSTAHMCCAVLASINLANYSRKMDKINHPVHYKGACAEGKAMLISAGFHPSCAEVECIQTIEKLKLNYHLGNAFKYIYRAGKKDTVRENFEKALWYLKRWKNLGEPFEGTHREFNTLKDNIEAWLTKNT